MQPVGFGNRLAIDNIVGAAAVESTTGQTHDQIPVIDMEDCLSNEAWRQERFTNGLRDAFRTHGFVAVKNPGVDKEKLRAGYEAAKRFFDLPREVKMQQSAQNNGQRGYVPGETAKGDARKDLKEFYHIGRELTAEQQDRLNYEKNIWPDNAFKQAMTEMFTALESYRVPLEEAIAKAIGQPIDRFTSITKEGQALLRALHYFANPPADAVWAAEHTDIDLYTILPHATEKGLQVKRGEEWITVEVPEDAFIINCGDMLESMTNGEFKSAVHRVIPMDADRDRYSMVLFIHPRDDDQIGPLKESITRTGGIKRYADGTRKELLAERLIELGLAGDDFIRWYATTGHQERQINIGRSSERAMKKLRDMGLASEKVLAFIGNK